ncbi:MAG: hypothetical protein LAP39_01925 [Acidobacteriia bacterium]|nr:hypothetical protein [Terriglobia bacterium]
MEEVLSMSRGLCLPFLLLAAASAVFCQTNANLDLADTYEQLKRWPEAEKYFQEAAKDSDLAVRRQALAGIVRVHTAANGQHQELAGARYYNNAGVLDKAEEQYVTALKSDSQDVRNLANSALQDVQSELWLKRRFDRVLQWVAYLAFVIGVFSVIVLIWTAIRVKNSVELRAFIEVGEHVSGKAAYWLAYVRARIASVSAPLPAAISPLSAELLFHAALPEFRDELPEPQNELEVSGVKIPFASLVNVLVKPKVRISGGWIAPAAAADGTAFGAISRPSSLGKERGPTVFMRPLRAATLDQDLEAFAYDVYIKAVEAHAS